jgi:hypothetical protein
MNMKHKIAGALALAPLASFAALDPAVGTAITSAQTDLLAVVALLVGVGVALWAASTIYRRFFKV